MVGTRDAPGIKTMKWKILISFTNNYCSINTLQSPQQKQRRGSPGESLVGEGHPTAINSSPD